MEQEDNQSGTGPDQPEHTPNPQDDDTRMAPDDGQRSREPLRQATLWEMCDRIRLAMPRFPGVERVYLVSSGTKPGATPTPSDVDIAIEGRLSAEDYFALWWALEEIVPSWQVDLVQLDQDMHVAARVRERGMMIYERSDYD
jgi:predicted nucleotidyltransferase